MYAAAAATRGRKMALHWGAHRPRHYLVVRFMMEMRFCLIARIRSRILRAISQSLRQEARSADGSRAENKCVTIHFAFTGSLRGSSVEVGTIQRILAWPLRKDDAHTSRSVNNMLWFTSRLQTTLYIIWWCTSLHISRNHYHDYVCRLITIAFTDVHASWFTLRSWTISSFDLTLY